MLDQTYTIGKLLGCGGSSKVYSVTTKEGLELAAKIIDSSKIKNHEKSYSMIMGESLVYDLLGFHPSIVNSAGCNPEGVIKVDNKDHIIRYMLLESCKNGTLGRIIRKTGALEEKLAKILFLQIATAVKHIHSKGFAHMDIKLENILLDDYFNAKLSDLGTATYVLDSYGFTQREVGTRGYIDPEILARDKRDDNFDAWAADIYSLGV